MRKQTVVIKIGSSSLTQVTGEVSVDKLSHIVQQVATLKKVGHKVVIVSSGAVACGFRLLKLNGRPRTIREKQAAAAVGQGILIQHYRQLFRQSRMEIAQVLLNRSDFSDRQRYMNALSTLDLLLVRDIVPVINENDSVAVEEIRWGDNDFLAAQVAGLLQADWLVLVTSADGVYTYNPEMDPEAKPIPYISSVSQELLEQMDWTRSKFGTGGMRSKLEAASMPQTLGRTSTLEKRNLGTRGSWTFWKAEGRGLTSGRMSLLQAASASGSDFIPTSVDNSHLTKGQNGRWNANTAVCCRAASFPSKASLRRGKSSKW